MSSWYLIDSSDVSRKELNNLPILREILKSLQLKRVNILGIFDSEKPLDALSPLLMAAASNSAQSEWFTSTPWRGKTTRTIPFFGKETQLNSSSHYYSSYFLAGRFPPQRGSVLCHVSAVLAEHASNGPFGRFHFYNSFKDLSGFSYSTPFSSYSLYLTQLGYCMLSFHTTICIFMKYSNTFPLLI